MNDFEPLTSLERDELEVSLLRSAEGDQAPPAAMARVAASLGVSAALVAATTTASAASAASAAGAASSSAASVAGAAGASTSAAAGLTSAGTATLIKALIVGVSAGAVVTGAVATTSLVVSHDPPAVVSAQVRAATPARSSAPKLKAAAREPAAVAVESLALEAAPVPPPLERSDKPRALATASATAEEPAPAAEAPSPPEAAPAPTSSIAEEITEIDRARTLLVAGKPVTALSVLDEHDRRWPRAVLGMEASVLRVEAELARGNRAKAEQLARALIAAHPNTGYARKVARLVGLDQKQ